MKRQDYRGKRLARGAGFCALLVAGLNLAGCVTESRQQSNDVTEHLTPLSPAAEMQHNNSLLYMANAIAAGGDYDAALPLYRRAYQKNGDTNSLIALGKALSAVGEYQKAANVFKTSNDPGAVRGLANAYTAMGRAAEALPLLDKVLAKNPVDVDALNSLAVALDFQGRHDEAATTYERGLSIDPQHPGLRHNYGLSLGLAGSDFPRALELLKATSASSTATAAERQSLALVYALSGDDVTASHLLSIDLGLEETEKQLAYFQLIKALPPAERFRAVMAESRQPKLEAPAPATRIYDGPDHQKTETATRVVAAAAPVQAAPQAAAVETKPEADLTETPAGSGQPEQLATPAVPAPKKSPAKPAKTVSPAAGAIPAQSEPAGWRLQIASYRLTRNLEKGWRILKAKYADPLATMTPSYTMVDFGNREKRPKGKYYRLLSGPLNSRGEALEACRKLRALGAECIVRGPGNAESEK